jgi:integrase/recombinase XerD
VGLGKQAKTLSRRQVDCVLGYLATTRNPVRNRLIFLLSIRAGLRAKEIADLTWTMMTDSDGSVAGVIALQDHASKGRSGRTVPMCRELKAAVDVWKQEQAETRPEDRVIQTERSKATSSPVIINLLRDWYCGLGFVGCSSHSGRRTTGR